MITQVWTEKGAAPGSREAAIEHDPDAASPSHGQRMHGDVMSEGVVTVLAATFSALGDPVRLRIVHALSGGELCVGALARALDVAVPAVSQHLRVLRDLRIVRNRRDGRLIYYALDDAHVADLFAQALAHARGGST